MHRTIQVNIYPGEEGWYVAEAPEETGVYPGAPVLITVEMEPLHA